MQSPIQKFRQNSIVFEKPGILSETFKTFYELLLPYISMVFCWNFAYVSYLPMSTKACVGFFLFCLDLELFAKILLNLVSTKLFFTLLLITKDLDKIKKSRTSFFRYY